MNSVYYDSENKQHIISTPVGRYHCTFLAHPVHLVVTPLYRWSFVVPASSVSRPTSCPTVPRGTSSGSGYFGHKTLRHRDTSASQNWCRSLSRITSGAVSHQNCPGSKCPDFSSIMALMSTCLVPRFGVEVSWDRCRSVPECLDAEVSCGRSVR